MPETPATRVRAVWDAVRVPGQSGPYDTAHVCVHYPAAEGSGDATQGLVAPAGDGLPVLVLSGNFNCPPALYWWLAKRIARGGWAVCTYQWTAAMFDGRPGLSTGVDLGAVTPETYGERVPSTLLPALVEALPRVPEVGAALDPSTLVLGGHSAGGTLALLCSAWLGAPAFSYGGHLRTQVPQGFGADHYLPLPEGPPLLLMGGTEDGVGDAIARAQGQPLDGHPMSETARRSVPLDRRCDLVLVEGANHYSFCEAYDGSSGRGFLEAPASGDPEAVRDQIGGHVERFLAEVSR